MEKREAELEKLTSFTLRLWQNGGNKIITCLADSAEKLNHTCAKSKTTRDGTHRSAVAAPSFPFELADLQVLVRVLHPLRTLCGHSTDSTQGTGTWLASTPG